VKQVSLIFLATLIALPVWAGGDSSDGHSHAPPVPVPVPLNAPRALAASEDFEVVAILEGKQLVVYVDRFASNEPVVKALVEIDGAGLKGHATEAAPGVYVIDVRSPLPPARHALTISIEADDTADLLLATLDTSQPAGSSVHVHNWSERAVWIIAVLLLAAGALLIARRNKRKSRGF
jgi:hypothetical protein